jgi:glycosyltransferase involved in cell wall biosynthesis
MVVPVYESAATLVELHERLLATLRGMGRSWEVVYVDDGSRDGSWDIIRGFAERDPGVRALRFARNAGQTDALAEGFGVARGELVGMIDADIDTWPEDLPLLVARVDAGIDLVGGRRVGRRTIRRQLPSRFFNWRLRRHGLPFHDVGCGMNVMRGSLAREIVGYRAARRGFRFKPLLAALAGSVEEVPIRGAKGGPSTYRLSELLYSWFEAEIILRKRPLVTPALGGLALVLGGIAALVVSLAGSGGDHAVAVGATGSVVAVLGVLLLTISVALGTVLRALVLDIGPAVRIVEDVGDGQGDPLA